MIAFLFSFLRDKCISREKATNFVLQMASCFRKSSYGALTGCLSVFHLKELSDGNEENAYTLVFAFLFLIQKMLVLLKQKFTALEDGNRTVTL